MTAPVRVKRRKVQRGMTLTPRLGPGLGFGLAVVAFYFLIPIISSFEFSIRGANNNYSFEAYGRITTQPDFGEVLGLTARLALVTVFLSTVIMSFKTHS